MHPELDFPAFQWLRSCQSKVLVLSYQQVQPISPSTHPSSCPGIPFQAPVSPPDSLPCSVPRKQAKPSLQSTPSSHPDLTCRKVCFWAAGTEVTRKKMGKKCINLLLTPPVSIFFFVASETCKISRPLQSRPFWPTGWISFPKKWGMESGSQASPLVSLLY